jgi:hypothetical protein
LLDLESQAADYVAAKVYYDSLLVIYGGRFLKFGRLVPAPKKVRKASPGTMELVLEKTRAGGLEDARLHFTPGVEIVNLLETLNRNWLQIVAYDHEYQIYSVITWDFDQNME